MSVKDSIESAFLSRFLLERWREMFCSFLWDHWRLPGVETHSGIHLTCWILSLLLLLHQGCSCRRSRWKETVLLCWFYRPSRESLLRIRIEWSGEEFQQCVWTFRTINPPRYSRCSVAEFGNCRLSARHTVETCPSRHAPNVHETKSSAKKPARR